MTAHCWSDGTAESIDSLTERPSHIRSMLHRSSGASALVRDRDGGLWIGTSRGGLLHVHQGRTDVFSPSDGLSGDDVLSLFEDREGSIWVATSNGLDRFREFSVSTFTTNQGLTISTVQSTLADRDGSVWLSVPGALNRWSGGRITIYGRSAADPHANTNAPLSLFQDRRGRIWGVTSREFGYLDNDRFISLNGIPGGVARSIVEDADGDLWIANQDLGLFHLRGTEVVQQIPWSKLGRKDFAAALAVDPFQGGLWLGYFQGGIAHFKDGKIQESYGAADGLGEGRVNDLRLGPDGTLWAATEGGLSRLKNNRFATLTSRNGLPCDTVHWVMEDDDRSFWLYSTCGLVRIAPAELGAWIAAVDQEQSFRIHASVFDSSDGVMGQAYPFGFGPQVARSGDGKIWFPGLNGARVVDPRHLPFNSLPPPVHIEQITADRKSYEVASAASGALAASRADSRSRDRLHGAEPGGS